jgi:competence protein ComEC
MLQIGRPSLAWVVLFFALFAAVPYLDRRAVRPFAAACLALLIVLPVGGAWLARQKNELTFTMLDVGQGLSILVQAPGGKNLLIDGGPDPHGRITAPFLASRGVRRLDAIVSTHPHPDHYEGLAPIVKRFAVGEIWTIAMPRAFPEMGEWTVLLAHARERGIPIRTLSRDTPPFEWNGLLVEPLNPPADPPLAWEPNDRALALRLSWRGRTMLVTADMEAFAEDSLLGTGRDLRADLVQVAHHGSASSSQPAFVEAIHATNAMVPVGFQNQYRLPRREVVARWREYGAKVWRTDEDGAIECATDGRPWRCRSIAPPPSNPLLARRLTHDAAGADEEATFEEELAPSLRRAKRPPRD